MGIEEMFSFRGGPRLTFGGKKTLGYIETSQRTELRL
jgi:hypothetical protein